MKKLITHNGSFHSDDIFAAATIGMMLERAGELYEIIRTRESAVIETGDYVFDVGDIYDASKNRFDHHQTGGAGKHANGIEYASFGLVWEKFGKELTGSEEVAAIIEKKLVSPIDAGDNGISLVENKSETSPYFIQNFFSAMYPTWKEEDEDVDQIFLNAVKIAKDALKREIKRAADLIEARDSIIESYKNAEDKRIVVLDRNYPIDDVTTMLPETLFVIYPRTVTGDWGAKALRDGTKTFKNKKDFPEAWAGLRDEELQKITGVHDAVFCHRALFLSVAQTKEGAVKLAQIAVES
jgi:uncharacterized UPF0160 family protein